MALELAQPLGVDDVGEKKELLYYHPLLFRWNISTYIFAPPLLYFYSTLTSILTRTLHWPLKYDIYSISCFKYAQCMILDVEMDVC